MKRKWLTIGFICWVVVIIVFSQIKVTAVECDFEGSSCSDPITNELKNSLLGTSFFFNDHFHQISQQTNSSLILKKIDKALPGKLIVYYQQEPSLYQIDYQGKIIEVSESGFIKKVSSINEATDHLPIVYIKSDQPEISITEIGQPVPKELNDTLMILTKQLKNLKINQATIDWFSDQEIRINYQDKVLITDEANAAGSVEAFWSIINSSELSTEIENEVKEIDLRFELPVLRTR